MYRTKLARTLLVLGIGASCQRADELARSRQPLVDDHDRPAVGNIGQTGRPDPVRTPLVDPEGSPAVGNIGQTGAVAPLVDDRTRRPAPPRRVVRRASVPRAERRRAPVSHELATDRALEPLITRDERPAVGNVPRKGAPDQRLTNGREVPAIEPLETRARRPATGNVKGRFGGHDPEGQR